MSVDHTYEICRDDSSHVFVNISGLNEGGKQIAALAASIYAYDSQTGQPKFTCQLSIEDLRRLHHHLSKYSIVTDAELIETGKFIEVKGNTEELLTILSAAEGSELLPALKNLVLKCHDIVYTEKCHDVVYRWFVSFDCFGCARSPEGDWSSQSNCRPEFI